MNFQHFLEMLEFNLWYFLKMSKIHYIKMLEIKSQHLTLGEHISSLFNKK